jgi:hypothetical protein
VNFTTIDALERELQRLESRQQLSLRNDIPDYPVEFAVSLGIVPDEWQVEVLASDHPRKILCCGRQTGKSTVAAILALHKALTQPGSVVLVVAPGERQAKLLFSKAASLYRQAGYPLPAHSERRTGLELSNGSVIEALPAVERTTRGYSVNLLVVDEAAAVPDMDYFGILPALIATQGEQVLLSTPRGKRGFSMRYGTRPRRGDVTETWTASIPPTTGCGSWSAPMKWGESAKRTSKSSDTRCPSNSSGKSSTVNGWIPKARSFPTTTSRSRSPSAKACKLWR